MTALPMIGLREFRDGIADITEPVRVVKTRNGITDLGVWLPASVEISVSEAEGSITVWVDPYPVVAEVAPVKPRQA